MLIIFIIIFFHVSIILSLNSERVSIQHYYSIIYFGQHVNDFKIVLIQICFSRDVFIVENAHRLRRWPKINTTSGEFAWNENSLMRLYGSSAVYLPGD